jgi:DNA-binding transcriptional ArsR family regulator
MENVQALDYRSALEQRNRRAILEELAKAGGQIQSLPLKRSVGLSQNTFEHHINILRMNNIISIEGDKIRLERKTPLCYIFNSTKIPYVYLGLLGERKGRSESETETALKLLAKENLNFERVIVLTTEKCETQWEKFIAVPVEWKLIGEREIRRIETIQSKVEPHLIDLAKNYILVMDCTSLTKPATIAYYKLATKHSVPLIYVYEDRKELSWIISKEDLKKKLLPDEKSNKKGEASREEDAKHIKFYQTAFKNENWKRVLKELATVGKPIGIGDLAEKAKMGKSTLSHILDIFEEEKIITSTRGERLMYTKRKNDSKKEKGKHIRHTVELTHKSPLCYIFDSTNVNYAYLGLLGRREQRSESETETALKLLAKENFPKNSKDQKHEIKVTVFETYKSIPEWENIAPSNINWHLLRDEEITNVKTVEEKVEQVLKELIRNHILVMDCTALNKPATIAYYKLAEKYMIPLIYVYEDEKELIWLISKEDIKRELLPPTEKDERQN